MKTPIGIDKNTGALRLIDDVESGLKCNCICPACKVSLQARKGKIKAHHFSHHQSSEQQACRETAIHLMAKYVIKQSSTILFPTRTTRSKVRKTYLGESLQHEKTHFNDPQSITDCREEVYLSDHKIKPDILCKTNMAGETVEVAIEVVVTHKVDDDKLKKIKHAGLTTYEINLADLTDGDTITFDEIKKALAERYRQSWVYFNPLISGRFKKELQIKTDKWLSERNTVITEWGNNVRSYFIRRGFIRTPAYSMPEGVTDPKVRTIDNKYVKVALPVPPNLAQSFTINSVEDISKAELILNISHRTTTYPLPITIHLPSTKPAIPIGSYLELTSDKLPPAEEIEPLLVWKKSIKIDNYIEEVRKTKEAKKTECDTPIKEKVKKNMEWLRSIRRYEIQPVFPNIDRIHQDYLNAKKELTRKGFTPEKYTTNVTDGWILGCPDKYWQIILVRAICFIENDSVDIKYYATNLEKHRLITTIEPVRSLVFIPSTLRNMNYNTNEVPNSFKVISKYFKHLENLGLLQRKRRGGYHKLMPYGEEYKAL